MESQEAFARFGLWFRSSCRSARDCLVGGGPSCAPPAPHGHHPMGDPSENTHTALTALPPAVLPARTDLHPTSLCRQVCAVFFLQRQHFFLLKNGPLRMKPKILKQRRRNKCEINSHGPTSLLQTKIKQAVIEWNEGKRHFIYFLNLP